MNSPGINYNTIQLRRIELLESCLFHCPPQLPEVFNFDIKVEHKPKPEHGIIAVDVTIDIFDEKGDLKLGTLKSNCLFEIVNMNEFIDRKRDKPNLPEELLTKINAISISTARGIMYSQFRGTFLDKAYLPVFDPKSFIIQK